MYLKYDPVIRESLVIIHLSIGTLLSDIFEAIEKAILRKKTMFRLMKNNAGDGSRTRTGLPPTVFKTVASAIPPLRHEAPQ